MNATRALMPFVSMFALVGSAVAQDTTRVSVDSSGVQGNGASEVSYYGINFVSADGNLVVFSSSASNLVAGDTNGASDIFVHDRSTGVTERVSVDSAGAEGNGGSVLPTITPSGRFVTFESVATNLVAGDTNGQYDIFVHDRVTGVTERVSVDSSGAEGNKASGLGLDAAGISADGNVVAFTSAATNLVAGDTNAANDVFVHDRTTGITERVSVDSTGAQAKFSCHGGAISADGRVVAFYSNSPNLVSGDTNGQADAFVHDRSSGITERVSVDSSGAEGNAGSDHFKIVISADGDLVGFVSGASNLVPGDTNGSLDVFLRDRSAGTTERISVDSAGVEGNKNSFGPSISADKRFVCFVSAATNLVAGDTNGFADTFVHDRAAGTTEMASVDSSGIQGIFESNGGTISADGEVVAFSGYSDNLVPGDTNRTADVFVRHRCDAYWSNYGAGFPGTNGVPALTAQTDPVLGTTVAIDLANSSGSLHDGLLFIGFQHAQIPSGWGGDLLVDPSITLLLSIPASGTTILGTLPDDDTYCSLEIDLQAIEVDPGAVRGVSFTSGLQLVLGR